LAKRVIHGVKNSEIINRERISRDTRKEMQKLLSWIGDSQKNLGIFILVWVTFLFLVPALWLIGLIFFGMMTLAFYEKATGHALPLRVPMSIKGVLDYNSPNPGRLSYKKPSGIFYLGQEFDTNLELWAGASDVLTHMLVFGTTGSGKAQPLDSKILTPTGWVLMRDIKIGDIVCTPDGGVASVTGVFPQDARDIYTINLEDRRRARACNEHLWKIRDINGLESIKTTEEIKNLKNIYIPFFDQDNQSKIFSKIDSIEKTSHEEACCIMIDHPDHLYITDDFIITHNTEFLTGLCTNSLTNGAGVVFVDPKGTNTLWYKLHLLSRIMGRDDDALLINYSTGGKKVEKFTIDRKSNTLNPFSTGTAETLSEMLSAFVPVSNGDNAVFSQRALAFLSSIMYPLVFLRDAKAINLSVSVIREYMPLDKIMLLAGFPEKKPVHGVEIPDDVVLPLRAYLRSVAGFNEKKETQAPETSRQHDFSQSYFTRPLASMMDTYGFIYGAEMGEIDFRDIVYNRRILCILLPAMEKSAPELKQAGGMILQGLKGAMSLGLGDVYEGSVEKSLLTLPSASNVPTLMIADEYGYVATEGFAVIPAQARGLGFAFVFAGQDYAGFKRGSETEAEQIVANTKIKVLMALEDPSATLELFNKLAGQVTVSRLNGYDTDDENFLGKGFKDSSNVTITNESPIDIRDLKDQIEGEFHMFYRSSIIRGQSFHAALEPEKMPSYSIKILRGLEVRRPTDEKISKMYGPLGEVKAKLADLFNQPTDKAVFEITPDKSLNPFTLEWNGIMNKVVDARTWMDAWFRGFDEALSIIDNKKHTQATRVENETQVEDESDDTLVNVAEVKSSPIDDTEFDDVDMIFGDPIASRSKKNNTDPINNDDDDDEGSPFDDPVIDDDEDEKDHVDSKVNQAKNEGKKIEQPNPIQEAVNSMGSVVNLPDESKQALKTHLTKIIEEYPKNPVLKKNENLVHALFSELIDEDRKKSGN